MNEWRSSEIFFLSSNPEHHKSIDGFLYDNSALSRLSRPDVSRQIYKQLKHAMLQIGDGKLRELKYSNYGPIFHLLIATDNCYTP